jgi:hypothetical protein
MNERVKRGWFSRIGERREGISTLLMGLAAVVTTWCAFESTKWSGVQSIAFADGAAARVESTRYELEGNQMLQVDIATFLAWLEALQADLGAQRVAQGGPYEADPSTLSGFLYGRFRKDFRPAVHAWVASRPLINAEAAPTPFAMKDYKRPLAEIAARNLERAEQRAADGRAANRAADNYMLTTVITALVVFFAGLSAKLQLPVNGLIMLGLAWLMLFVSLIALTRLPVKIW